MNLPGRRQGSSKKQQSTALQHAYPLLENMLAQFINLEPVRLFYRKFIRPERITSDLA